MFISSITFDQSYFRHLLEVTTPSVRKLILKVDWPADSVVEEFLDLLENLIKNDHQLPSVINLLFDNNDDLRSSDILQSWPSSSYTVGSLEIGLYDSKSTNGSLSFHTTNEVSVWSSSNTSSY